MKKPLAIIALLSIATTFVFGQPVREQKVGHIFYVTLPEYMSRTAGLNSAASLQYKSEAKEVYGFIIEDNKEEMGLVDLKYGSIDEFYESFIGDFLKDEEKRTVSDPVSRKKGDINVLEADASFYDKESKLEIYYLVGIVETKTSYYKIISWSTLTNKEKYKQDFQKIVYSVRD